MLGNHAAGPSSLLRRFLFPTFLFLLVFLTVSAHAQVQVKVNDDVSFRIGAQLQLWADEAQDAATREYAANLFVRRARFLVTGSVAPNVTFFIQTDDPNLGKAPKSLTTGFLLQDAWAEWKPREEFAIEAGLMLVPLDRTTLTSTTSFITIDGSATGNANGTPTQSSATRDTGFMAKGYILDGRLEYRAGLFQGVRNTATTTQIASHNAFRRAGWLSYDFWEKERGYVYAGTNRGTKKVLQIGSGYDAQKDYRAFSADLHTTIPVLGKDEVAILAQGVRYSGGKFLPTLPRQNDYVVEAGFYVAPVKTQPFVKFEDQKFSAFSPVSKDQKRYAAGVNYYVYGQNLKFTGQLTHVKPATSTIKASNEATIQMQVWYY
jgi:hypothetical protein